MNRWFRKIHRWGGLITFVPLGLVIITGLILQVKKEFNWIQPPTQRGASPDLNLTFPEILAAVKSDPAAGVESWEDIDRLDVRPDRGVIKVRTTNFWEVQIDGVTGNVLQSQTRRSDWIEMLHDGSYFHSAAKLWVFLPNGLVLLGLWGTGAYLWWLPIGVKRRKRRKQQEAANQRDAS